MDKVRLDGDYAVQVTLMSVKSLSNLVAADIKMPLDLNNILSNNVAIREANFLRVSWTEHLAESYK